MSNNPVAIDINGVTFTVSQLRDPSPPADGRFWLAIHPRAIKQSTLESLDQDPLAWREFSEAPGTVVAVAQEAAPEDLSKRQLETAHKAVIKLQEKFAARPHPSQFQTRLAAPGDPEPGAGEPAALPILYFSLPDEGGVKAVGPYMVGMAEGFLQQVADEMRREQLSTRKPLAAKPVVPLAPVQEAENPFKARLEQVEALIEETLPGKLSKNERSLLAGKFLLFEQKGSERSQQEPSSFERRAR